MRAAGGWFLGITQRGKPPDRPLPAGRGYARTVCRLLTTAASQAVCAAALAPVVEGDIGIVGIF